MQAHKQLMSIEILEAIKRGKAISQADYHAALLVRDEATDFFDSMLAGYEGLLSASATGEAPIFEEGTGDSICNCLWSLTGYPSVSLPISGEYEITGPNGLGSGYSLPPPQDGM